MAPIDPYIGKEFTLKNAYVIPAMKAGGICGRYALLYHLHSRGSFVILFVGHPTCHLVLFLSPSHLKSVRPNRHPTGPSCICARIFSCNVSSSSHNVSLFLLRERSLLISFFIAASGLLVGGTVGIIRSPHPGLFAFASGIQCGFMGMTFFSKCSDLIFPATNIEKTRVYKKSSAPQEPNRVCTSFEKKLIPSTSANPFHRKHSAQASSER